MRYYLKITYCFFVLVLLMQTASVGQRLRTNQKPVLPKEKDATVPVTVPIDIVENSGTFYYEIVLKNFPVGKVTHRNKELFIQRVIEKIQELRVDKDIVRVEIVGWADGTVNYGISKDSLKLIGECAKQFNPTIYDKELALLRACEIRASLTSGIISHSIELADKIDSHDEKDNQNIGGFYRKVVVKIFN